MYCGQSSEVIFNFSFIWFAKYLRYLYLTFSFAWAGVAQSVQRLWAGRSGDLIPMGLRFPATRRDRPWGTPRLLHPPPSYAEVKERVEQCLYSPSGPSWPVLRWTIILMRTIIVLCQVEALSTFLASINVWIFAPAHVHAVWQHCSHVLHRTSADTIFSSLAWLSHAASW